MGILIDTSVLIEHERKNLDVQRYLDTRDDEEFFLSVITASELLHGVHRAIDASTRSRRAAWVESILERFPLLPLDLPAARAHAQVWAELSATGRLIGAHDLWLAASCIAHGLSLATANVGQFPRVPGLVIEHWR